MSNASAWFAGQSFCGRSAPKPETRYTYACTCGKCGGLDSGGYPKGASHVSLDKSWHNAPNINCPNGGTWRCCVVETLTADQVAAEEKAIFGRVR